MSHSLCNIWVHAIWSTKYRIELIDAPVERQLYEFLTNQFEELGCYVRIINGMPDHVHCLFKLNRRKSLSDVMKQVKGSSAHYVNQKSLTDAHFAWQTGYGAFSVSESSVNEVQQYILNQKEHHSIVNFSEEIIRLRAIKDN